MKLEIGKYPEQGTLKEIGAKAGDVVEWIGFEHIGNLRADYLHDGDIIFKATDGKLYVFVDVESFRIISRAPTPSPVRTVTRKEIVPGVYGNVHVERESNGDLLVDARNMCGYQELRAAAETLIQIADALENNA